MRSNYLQQSNTLPIDPRFLNTQHPNQKNNLKRRTLLKSSLGPALMSALGSDRVLQLAGAQPLGELTLNGASQKNLKAAHVVIVGAGFGGTTAAKYLRLLSNQQINVTLIEPDPYFVSCPLSNLVITGSKSMSDITLSYKALQQNYGIQVIKDRVASIDPLKRKLVTLQNLELHYDYLVISPGVELMYDEIMGLKNALNQQQVLQAWGSTAESVLLKQQLEAMNNGEIFALSVPELPYRCPPGPYERASLVANYFKKFKPKSKVIILDANQDVTSKGALFKRFWAENYPHHLEYRPEHKVMEVDGANRTIKFEIQDDLKAAVLNVLPPMRAGAIAVQTGLANVNKRWCEVDFLSFESSIAPWIHVLGDSIQAGPYMPKSAHMANAHAKVAAAAIVAKLCDFAPNPRPWLTNTCYSFVDPTQAIYIASVHQYDPKEHTFKILANAGGVSGAPSEKEGEYALGWAKNIWADCLA